MPIEKNLRDLCAINGLPSREDDVANYMYEQFAVLGYDVSIDTIGNVICEIPSNRENAKKVVIFAHTDQIGFIIRKIEENGFIRFERIGGVNTQILPGLKVQTLDKQHIGIIGVQSHHFMSPENKFIIPPIKDLYMDFGFNSKDQAEERGVRVGDMLAFDDSWCYLNSSLISSKSIDDRIGCALLLDLAEAITTSKLDVDVYLVACVMEEFNIRGILPAINRIQPDISIGIDITPSCDTPDLNYNSVHLGGGPALTYMNFHGRGTLAGVLPDSKLITVFEILAHENRIKLQREVAPGVITENAYIMFQNLGVSVMNISIPTRYTHTPHETIDLKDAIEAVKLLKIYLEDYPHNVNVGKEKRREGKR